MSAYPQRASARRRTLTSWAAATIALGALVAPLLTACSPADSGAVDFSEGANGARIQEWIDGQGVDTIDWTDCSDEMAEAYPADDGDHRAFPRVQCGSMVVPVDWFAPLSQKSTTTTVALLRAVSPDASHGDLIINPGGPGGSGVTEAVNLALSDAGEPVRQNFNIVGFDPRGVRSVLGVGDPFGCDDLSEDVCTPSKKLAHFASTPYVAHDMEYLRMLLGGAPVNYLGYSYGTYLGSMYATLFPSSVGAMVFDGPAPASLETDLAVQNAAIDAVTSRFLSACAAGELGPCPFSGNLMQAREQLAEWADELGQNPVTIDETATVDEYSIDSYLTSALYAPRSQWPTIADTLVKAKAGDMAALEQLATESAAVEDGFGQAVTCAMAGTQDLDGCESVPLVDPEVDYAGTSPILVFANTGDPATPYATAADLVDSLHNAVLVTVNAEGHTSLFSQSACASQIAMDYLTSRVLPVAGTRCEADG